VYLPEVVEAHSGDLRDPHNTIVLILSDWGLAGLLLYLGYYLTCFRLLIQVRKRAPEGGIWYYRSLAIQTALVAIFVAGLFSDRLYAEVPYWMGALAVALHRLQSHKLAQQESSAVAEPRTRPESSRVTATGVEQEVGRFAASSRAAASR
jgi:O-antigen ligase